MMIIFSFPFFFLWQRQCYGSVQHNGLKCVQLPSFEWVLDGRDGGGKKKAEKKLTFYLAPCAISH